MRAASGAADIVKSAVVATFGGADLTVEIDLPESQTYTLEWRFSTDSSSSEYVSCVLEPWRAIFYVVNQAHTRRGSTAPVLLGYLGEAPYYLHFQVELQGGGPDRIVSYTVFRGREDAGIPRSFSESGA